MDMNELNKFFDCKNAFESAQQKIGGEAKEIYLEYFKAGMQHQQAKVEELQVQLKGAEERAQLILQYKDKYRLERDALQQRIDVGVDKLTFTIITMLKQIRANPDVIRNMPERQFNQHLAELEQALKGEG